MDKAGRILIPLCSPAQARALDPRDQCSTGAIVVYDSGGSATYRGLHARLEGRVSPRIDAAERYGQPRKLIPCTTVAPDLERPLHALGQGSRQQLAVWIDAERSVEIAPDQLVHRHQ